MFKISFGMLNELTLLQIKIVTIGLKCLKIILSEEVFEFLILSKIRINLYKINDRSKILGKYS